MTMKWICTLIIFIRVSQKGICTLIVFIRVSQKGICTLIVFTQVSQKFCNISICASLPSVYHVNEAVQALGGICYDW